MPALLIIQQLFGKNVRNSECIVRVFLWACVRECVCLCVLVCIWLDILDYCSKYSNIHRIKLKVSILVVSYFTICLCFRKHFVCELGKRLVHILGKRFTHVLGKHFQTGKAFLEMRQQ